MYHGRTMTHRRLTVLAFALVATAIGTVVAQQTGFTRIMLQDHDISIAGHHVVQARAEFQPGVTSGRHTHPGEEVAYVLEGQVEILIEGKAPQVIKAGEPFFVPAGVVHEGRNIGASVAKILATYVVQKDKPVSTPVK
jgi:quercetin dioxygenase-like cupin family protein